MYIKIENSKPEIYTISQLRRDYANTSFPEVVSNEILSRFNVYPYKELQQPLFNEKTQKIDDGEFYKDVDSNWVKGYTVLSKTQEEVAQWIENKSAELRAIRNFLLQETDYLALVDSTLTPEMVAYRQGLRDITAQEGFPENVVWPIKP